MRLITLPSDTIGHTLPTEFLSFSSCSTASISLSDRPSSASALTRFTISGSCLDLDCALAIGIGTVLTDSSVSFFASSLAAS